MEKKFILKSSGETVKIGDTITLHQEVRTPYGKAFSDCTFPISESNLNSLIKDGIIVVKEEKVNAKQPSDKLESYIEGLASSLGWTYDKTLSYVAKLSEIYLPAAFSLLLKTIAKRLDKKYDGHISEAKEIWVVSLVNGTACKLPKENIKNYDNFAAFRTKEDAEFALKVLSPLVEDMYGE